MKKSQTIGLILCAAILIGMNFVPESIGLSRAGISTLGILVAIIIALMGVFGIVLFETEHRRHETAVRKVLGAEGNDIVSLFCKQYILTVIIACAMATPIAMTVPRQWLEQFTTQVEVSPWLYIAAFAVVAVLTLGIIVIRTISAAKENPVNNLKSE